MQFSKKTIRTILLLILFTVAIVSVVPFVFNWARQLLWLFFSALSPVFIGLILALILNVPLSLFENHVFVKIKKNGKHTLCRILSLICTLIVLLGILAVVVYFMAPSIYNSIQDIMQKIPDYTETVRDFLLRHKLPTDFLPDFVDGSLSEFVNFLGTLFDESQHSSIFSNLFNVATSFFGQTINFLLGLVFCLYILILKERVIFYCARAIHALLPEKVYRKSADIAKMSASTFANYISGQFIDAVLLGSMVMITMLIFRIPYAPLIGTLIAIFALIPMLGAWVSAFIAVLLLLTISPFKALLFAIIYIVLQGIDNYFIYPRIVGNAVSLPGILVLFAVALGSKFAGVFGLIFSVPIVAVIYTLFNNLVDWRLAQRQKQQATPLENDTEEAPNVSNPPPQA